MAELDEISSNSFLKEVENNGINESILFEESGEDEGKTEIDPTILDNLSNQLEQLISVEKIYLDPQLSTGKLAEQLSTNKKYLQKAIRKKFDANFIDFINGLRINEAIKIMNSEDVKSLNMQGIASKCGFNNRVTFTRVFKQITGVSPSFFLANIKKL